MSTLKQYITVLAVAAGMVYLPGLSSAQTSSSNTDTSNVYPLDEIIISAGRLEENPSSVGRNVSVITREEIEQSVYSSVGDVLADQQSIHMAGPGQTPGSLQQGFLRNANSNHTVVMIDGIRISDPSTVNNGIDFSELSLAGVDRIEVVRGSHSTLYGSSAIGGVINIITQKRGAPGLNVNLDTQHGIFGPGTYSTLNNAGLNATFQNGFYADFEATQKYARGLDATIDTVSSPGSFNPQDRDNFHKLDFSGKLGYKTSAADFHAYYRREDQTSDVDQAAFSDDDNATVDFNRDLFAMGGSYQLKDYLDLSFESAYSDLNRDFVNDSSQVDARGNYDGSYTETNGEGSLWDNELTASFSIFRSSLLLGLERSEQAMTFHTYTLVRPFDFESTTDLDSLDLKETISSVFVHADLNGGGMAESLEPLSLIVGSRLSDHNRFGTYLTYELNPRVEISPSALMYASLSTGFNAPSLYQLNAPEKAFGAYTARGNEDLEAEKSVSYEVGWKQSAGKTTSFRLSLFKTRVKDVIEYIYLWTGDKEIEDLGTDDYLGDTYVNISRQNVDGIEFGIEVQPFQQLTLGGDLTYTHSTLHFSPGDIDRTYTGGNHVQIFESGKFVDDEKKLSGLTRRPQITALFRATYKPVQKVRLSATSRFTGSRDDIFYSAALGPFGAQGRSKVDGYNLTDISVQYEFTQGLSVSAKVENLFDTGYKEINGYRTRRRGLFLKASYNL